MNILILRPGAIGDTLLTFAVISALRARYNNPSITLVGNAAVLPLAMACGVVDDVSDYGQLQWSELFLPAGIHNLMLREQLRQTDLAVCWLRDADGTVERNLRAAGVQRVVVAPGRPAEGRRVHVVKYLAESVGLEGNLLAPCNVLSIAGHTDICQHHTIAMHPGSGGAQKCWPISSFAAAIERLWQREFAVLLLAGPSDHERLAHLQGLLTSPTEPHMLEILIDAPLVTVAQHLLQCQCYLGNDSGITHLAAMLGIPTLVLFGPTDPAIWRPVGPYVDVIQAGDLEKLAVDVVIERLTQRL